MKVYKDLTQGSEIWSSMRRGKVTGTRLEQLMGTPLARTQLIAELIAEYASEQTKTFKTTTEMEWGNEQEEIAVKAFESKNKVTVDRNVGFIISDKYDWLGFSPDGVLLDGKEMIEIKNPDTKTNMFYRLTNIIGMQELGLGTWSKPTKVNPESTFSPSSKEPFCGIPADYKYQVLCGFLVNEICERIHFLVHDSRILDEEQKLYTVIVERNNPKVQDELKLIEEELIRFRLDWIKWEEAIMPTNF